MPALPPSQTRSVSLPLPLPLTIGRRWIHESVKRYKKVRLLVDGDVFGSSQVCDAMEYLAKQFGDVSALVFAAPGIVNNKNMNELSRRSEVSGRTRNWNTLCSYSSRAEPGSRAE